MEYYKKNYLRNLLEMCFYYIIKIELENFPILKFLINKFLQFLFRFSIYFIYILFNIFYIFKLFF